MLLCDCIPQRCIRLKNDSIYKLFTQQMMDQILFKMDNSPYYVVQPPLYDWNHPDTQAHINYESRMLCGEVDKKSTPPEPKYLKPWQYRLACQYNNDYNVKNNIDQFAHLYDRSDDEEDD